MAGAAWLGHRVGSFTPGNARSAVDVALDKGQSLRGADLDGGLPRLDGDLDPAMALCRTRRHSGSSDSGMDLATASCHRAGDRHHPKQRLH
jgi:hypothetical protein